MKKLLLLICLALLHFFTFAQFNVQQDNRISQVLKGAVSSNSGYAIYGRSNSARFINIAVLDQSSHTMSWFTCHGRLFDSARLTNQEFEQISNRLVVGG